MIITPRKVFEEVVRKGLMIHSVEGNLKVSPTKLLDEELINLIRANKSDLIELLDSQKDAISHWWSLRYEDGKTNEVSTWPPSTHSEMLALNPRAITAEPIPQPFEYLRTEDDATKLEK